MGDVDVYFFHCADHFRGWCGVGDYGFDWVIDGCFGFGWYVH